LLQTLKAPPEVGSLREWVLVLLLHRLEDIEHARLRAVVQVLVDKEQGVTAFEDYMKIAFPYLETRKRQEKDDAKKALMSWVKSGPLKVTPMNQEKKITSRMKERVVARMATQETQTRHSRLEEQWNKRRPT
jgi:hypothetical protein